MSQTCPWHLPAMYSEQRHVITFQEQSEMPENFSSIFIYVMCLQHVLPYSHVSSLLPVTWKYSQIIQIFNLWKFSLIPLWKISSLKISNNSKTKKGRVHERFTINTKMHFKASFISPLVPFWSHQTSVFYFKFLSKLKFKKLNWGNPHDLKSLLEVIMEKMLTM